MEEMAMEVFVNPNLQAEIRVIKDSNNNPLFVLNDVCCALGIENPRNTIDRLDIDDVHKMDIIDNLGRMQDTNCITESGLYCLVLTSNKPMAKEFKKWVTSEVLPTIRQFGHYSTKAWTEKALEDPDWAIEQIQAVKLERQRRKAEEQKRILAEMERDQAVRERLWIGNKREATAMNTASVAVRKVNKLEDELGQGKTYKSVKAIPWLKSIFNVEDYEQVWAIIGKHLSAISKELGYQIKKIPDSQYTHINAYHVEVISIFLRQLQENPQYLAKYRL